VEDGSLEITKDLNGAEKLVKVVGQAPLDTLLVSVGEEVDLRLLALGLRSEPCVLVQDAVPHDIVDGTTDGEEDEDTGRGQQESARGLCMGTAWGPNSHIPGTHGDGQVAREERVDYARDPDGYRLDGVIEHKRDEL
jgi:hypothetical protein